MSIHAIAPSPLARLLLELESRAASGGLDAGGRRIVLSKGGLVEVRPAPEDVSLGDFLVAAGRLTAEECAECKQVAAERRTSLEAVLRQKDLMPVDVLLETRRALWLERFVKGLALEEQLGRQPNLLTPEPHPAAGSTLALLPFVLDALTRRAALADAEHVGRHANAWFEWLDTPQRERASTWADFGPIDAPLQTAAIFVRHPAAPSRIAALARAGLARLSERKLSLPAPPPRNPSIAAPAPTPARVPSGSIEPPPLPAKPALAPGEADLDQSPLRIEPVAPWFPARTGALEDPLDPLEREIARLEQKGAKATARAQAWLELARAWREHYDSVDEQARACREAAGAAPEDPVALEAAAASCSAIGRPDLAYAYASAWAELPADANAKLRALTRAASYAARAAKLPSALRALRQAAELEQDDGSCAERYARALAARGEVAPAVEAARLAAKRYRERSPLAARTVLSWASELLPSDASVTAEYASSLAADGLVEAAIAALADGARKARSPAIAEQFVRNAAVRAELAARPDLAADVVLEALDNLGVDSAELREALLNDLTAAGAVVDVATLATEFALRSEGAERASYFARAADARLELPGDSTHATELYTRALCAAPNHARALSALAAIAENEQDPNRLMDAAERALRAPVLLDREGTLALIERFLALLAQHGGKPMLERWVFGAAANLGGRMITLQERQDLDARMARYEADLRTLELQLRKSSPEQRAECAIALADRMREDPARRAKAQKLYEKVLEVEPGHALARARFEALLRLEGNTALLSASTAQRVQLAANEFGRISALLAQLQLEHLQGNLEGARAACATLLAHAPRHREGNLLLWRLAKELGDRDLERDALIRRATSSLDPRERANTLCMLARTLIQFGHRTEALERAEAALALDPRCSAAARLVLEFHEELPLQRRLPALRAARAALGDTPDLLKKLAQTHYGVRDAQGQLEILEAHLRMSPFDNLPALATLVLRTTGADAEALLAAMRHAADPDRFGEGSLDALLAGLERLWVLGQRREALLFVLEAVDLVGEAVDDLVEWAVPCARELDDPRIERAILERSMLRTAGEARASALRRIAGFHRGRDAKHAEARAYLRLLAFEPTDTEALDRLAFIYAETREVERLMAVLTLRLELAATPEERRDWLLSLACAALDLADDPAGAEDLVRAALASGEEQAGTEPSADAIRRGVGLLLGSRAPQLAFDVLLALSETASAPRACALLEEAVLIAERRLENSDLALRAATLGLEAHPHHTAFLLHFERLALKIGDVTSGQQVYRQLADAAMGVHGRRALLYRAGRWLERAGAPGEALEYLEQAFVLSPSEGAMFVALERLARNQNQQQALVRALRVLADSANSPKERSRLLLRAATVCETDLNDPVQALDCLEHALRAAPDGATEARAFGCLERIAEPVRSAARARLQAVFEEQASEAWATKLKVLALHALTRLLLTDPAQTEQAERKLREAQVVIEGDDELSEGERSELRAAQAALRERLPAPKPFPTVDAMAKSGRESLRASEPSPRPSLQPERRHELEAPPAAVLVARVAGAEPTSPMARVSERPYDPKARLSTPMGRVQHSVGERVSAPRPRTNTDPGIAPSASKRPARSALNPEFLTTRRGLQAPPIPREEPPETPSDPSAREPVPHPTVGPHNAMLSTSSLSLDEILLDAVQRGDPLALDALRASLGGTPARAAHLCSTLLGKLQAASTIQVSGIRGLLILAEHQMPALASVCAEVLAYVDPSASPPRRFDAQAATRAAVDHALLEARDDGDFAPVFTLLAHVGQGAAPLFRRSLNSYGVGPNDFLGNAPDNAYAAALHATSAAFGATHEGYLHPSGEDRVALVPTQPLAVLIGDRTTMHPLQLRYRLARTYEAARPGSALLTTLAAESAQTLIAAVKAAFGPTDAKSPPVGKEAAALAAELWRTMPSSAQRQVSNLFRVLPTLPGHAELVDQINLRAARVALVLTQALDTALACFGTDADHSAMAIARTEADLDRALQAHAAVRGLVRFALSEPYLQLRSELLSAG